MDHLEGWTGLRLPPMRGARGMERVSERAFAFDYDLAIVKMYQGIALGTRRPLRSDLGLALPGAANPSTSTLLECQIITIASIELVP